MGIPQSIAKLCESRWAQLAHSNKEDQFRFASEFLQLLGWDEAKPLDGLERLERLGALLFMLRGESQTSVAAYFVMPGALEPPSLLAERGLDFCETARLLVNAARSLHADYAFVTDLFRAYLYDVRTDELILHTDTPTQFQSEFGDLLARSNIERGALEEVRRVPRSHAARQLREWCGHWCESLVTTTGDAKETVQLLLDRLLVVRYLFDHDILRRPGWRFQKRFADILTLAFRSNPAGCGRQLKTLFYDMWFDWKADLFAAATALDALLENDSLLAPLLKEFTLLSRSKFSIATLLESFNYGDAGEKARVRMVPEVNEDREHALATRTLNNIDAMHIEVDIHEEGYRAIFYWFDRVMELYNRLEIEFESHAQRHEVKEPDEDLFAWAEQNAKRPKSLVDKLQYLLEHGLSFGYTSPRQLRTGRLMLYLHIIAHYHKTKEHFGRFPSMKETFQKREPKDYKVNPWAVPRSLAEVEDSAFL